MTLPVPDTGVPQATPPPVPVHSTLAEAARQVIAEAVVPQAAQGQGAQERHADGLKPISGRQLVDWGGATREVDIGDLVKEARERETLESLRAAQRAELQSLGGAYAIQQAVDQMTPEQRQALAAVVQNPSLLARISGTEAAPDPLALEQGQAFHVEQPKASSRSDELAQIKQALGFLLQDAQRRDQRDRQQTREREIEMEMDRWPLLKQDAGARAYVSGQLQTELAQNPSADARQVVGKHVTALANLLSRAAPQETSGQEPVGLIPARQPPPKNGIAASANDILRGRSLKGAAAFLARFNGPR